MCFLKRLRTIHRPLICAEGCLPSFKERRGWSATDPNAHLMAIKEMHRETVRHGSDVIKTFAYQNETKFMIDVQKKEIEIALEVQAEFAKVDVFPLVAGGLCNYGMYEMNNSDQDEAIKNQYREQIRLFAEYGVDYVTGEAFEYFGDAELALSAIKEFELPSVITMSETMSKDQWLPHESCAELKKLGADMVGLDCNREDISSVLSILEKVKNYLGDKNESGIALTSVCYGKNPLDADLNDFGQYCKEMNVNYVGICCDDALHHTRAMAMAVGKRSIEALDAVTWGTPSQPDFITL